ncbi:hypothetical protein UCRPC4_g02267 [Phaeomoniella chlamydospora]|uniref:Uncharacterized protein n=1 Tax=Phaeomoniella chlamydospora TaxID=158046 RepID=A0A0G2ERX8_PHACM|nr:hypothetical protein UCRPC4_g02267 [Phaeomoniella chlamydospora]
MRCTKSGWECEGYKLPKTWLFEPGKVRTKYLPNQDSTGSSNIDLDDDGYMVGFGGLSSGNETLADELVSSTRVMSTFYNPFIKNGLHNSLSNMDPAVTTKRTSAESSNEPPYATTKLSEPLSPNTCPFDFNIPFNFHLSSLSESVRKQVPSPSPAHSPPASSSSSPYPTIRRATSATPVRFNMPIDPQLSFAASTKDYPTMIREDPSSSRMSSRTSFYENKSSDTSWDAKYANNTAFTGGKKYFYE